MNAKRKNILMLDDDLLPKGHSAAERRLRLQTWLRWFYTGDRTTKYKLIEAHCLQKFVDELQARSELAVEHEDYLHGFIIDVMWKEGINADLNFKLLGADLDVKPMEAGLQLLSIIFNDKYNQTRANFLEVFKERKFAILSTLNDNEGNLRNYIDNSTYLGRIEIIVKKISNNSAVESYAEPDDIFISWINSI